MRRATAAAAIRSTSSSSASTPLSSSSSCSAARVPTRRLDVLARQLHTHPRASSTSRSLLTGPTRAAASIASSAQRSLLHQSTPATMAAAHDGDKAGATPAALRVDPKDTIFAKIVDGSIPAKKVFEDDQAIAFHDIAPQAPTHILIIPKKPIGGVGDLKQEEEALMGHLMYVATQVAREQGISEDGYRLVINEGKNGQQSVRWLHIHLFGGRKMNWPPG